MTHFNAALHTGFGPKTPWNSQLALYSCSHQGLTFLSVYVNTNNLLMLSKAIIAFSCLEWKVQMVHLHKPWGPLTTVTDYLNESCSISHKKHHDNVCGLLTFSHSIAVNALNKGVCVCDVKAIHIHTHRQTRINTHSQLALMHLRFQGELNAEWWSKVSAGLKTCRYRKCNNTSGGIGD